MLGGTEDKNLPTNAVDTSSIPGAGRFHMPGANKPTSSSYQAPHAKPAESVCHNYWRLSSTREATAERSPLSPTRERPCKATKTQHNQKSSVFLKTGFWRTDWQASKTCKMIIKKNETWGYVLNICDLNYARNLHNYSPLFPLYLPSSKN